MSYDPRNPGSSNWTDTGPSLIPNDAGDHVDIPNLLRFLTAAYDMSRMTFTIGATTHHVWMDTNGVLRHKDSAPTGDLDGTPVSAQTPKKVVDVSAQIGVGNPLEFSVAPDEFVPGTVEVLRNGVTEGIASLTETPPSTVLLSVTPVAGERVEVAYIKLN